MPDGVETAGRESGSRGGVVTAGRESGSRVAW